MKEELNALKEEALEKVAGGKFITDPTEPSNPTPKPEPDPEPIPLEEDPKLCPSYNEDRDNGIIYCTSPGSRGSICEKCPASRIYTLR